ncbi:MAG TPA: hypothetical protein VF627_11600 [Abditibacterium sp.]|jgi:hypothetical protein
MKNLKFLVIAAALLLGLQSASQAQTAPAAETPATPPVAREAVTSPDKSVTDMLAILMGALEDDSYTMFMAPMAEQVKAALPKPTFEKVVAMMAPRIKAGYKTAFIDGVKRPGAATYLWKLKFADGGDDMIALLTITDGKAATFLLL